MKRFAAGTLAFAMMLTLGASAFASEEENDVIIHVKEDEWSVEEQTIDETADNTTAAQIDEGGVLVLAGDITLEGKENNGIVAGDPEADASEETVTFAIVDGSVSLFGGQESGLTPTHNTGLLANNADVVIGGDIYVDGCNDTGVKVTGNSAVIVTGDVTVVGMDSQAVSVYSKGEGEASQLVGVEGDAIAVGENSGAVTADGVGAVVMVEGDAVASGSGTSGVSVNNGATVVVDGDIYMEGAPSEGMSFDDENAKAISVKDGGTVVIAGDVDVIGDQERAVYIVGGESETAVVIDGTLSAQGNNEVLFGGDIDNYDDETIYVTTIETNETTSFTENDEEDKELLLSLINYIVHADEGVTVQRKADGGVLTELPYNEEFDLNYAYYNDELLVTLDGNYQFEDKNVNLKDNGDGTYTIVVTENGGLIFKAVLKTTKATKKQTVAQKMVAGKYGTLLTDADGNALSFTAKLQDGVATLTVEKTVAADICLTRSLVKALAAKGIETVKVVLGDASLTVALAEVTELYKDEAVENVIVSFDPNAGTYDEFKVVDGEKIEMEGALNITVC